MTAASPLPPAPDGALRTLLDALPIRVAMLDSARRHVYVNPVYCAAMGRSAAELVGRTVADTLGRVAFEKLAEFGDRALAGETAEWTGWYDYPEGRRWVTRVYAPRLAPDGTIDAYFVFVLDTTDAVEAKRRAEENENFRSAVVEHALDCVVAIDQSGAVVEFNPAAERTFGIARADAVGKPIADIIVPPEMRAAHAAGFARYLAHGGARMIGRRVEIEAQRADGTRFPVELALAEVRLDDRRLFVAYLRDLSERHRADAELRRQREALYQSEKLNALGSLLAGVAHELNNPLAIVLGQASLLAEKLRDPADAARAERVRAAADRCARIVRTFLAMARRRPPERRALDAGEIAGAARELLAYGLRADDIDVVFTVPAGLPPVSADSDQIHQVFANLILNAQQALRAVPAPRRIDVTAALSADGFVEIAFADNGPGVAEADVARLFEPFFTTKKQGEGTGIGLTMCRSILEAHGGSIVYRPNPGGGAVFAVRLPVDPGA